MVKPLSLNLLSIWFTKVLALLLALGLSLTLFASLLGWVTTVAAAPLPQPLIGETCFATPNNGTTVYSGTTAQPVRDAVAAATPGSVVKLAGYCPGVAAQNNSTQTVLITKVLTLQGGYTLTNWNNSYPLTQPTTLDAQGGGRVVYATVSTTLNSLMVTNGYLPLAIGQNGGGIRVSNGGNLTLTQVDVYSNTAGEQGGGLHVAGTAHFISTTIENNKTLIGIGGRGGGAYIFGIAYLTNTNFISNTSDSFGGGAFLNAGGKLTTVDFLSNTSIAQAAGGLYTLASTEITNSIFSFNRASTNGGAIDATGILSISNSTFLTNTALQGSSNGTGGGAIIFNGAAIMLDNTLLQGNISPASRRGGAIYASGFITITNSQFIQNTAGAGGGLNIGSATILINGSLFAGNRATNDTLDYGGGAVGFLPAASTITLSITNTDFISNSATQYGGAIYQPTGGNLTLSIANTTFADNIARQSGGGFYQSAGATTTLAITNTIFISNAATLYSGGAIYQAGNNTQRLTNVLFANNTATKTMGALGAAIFFSPTNNSTLQLMHTTIVGATPLTGSAVYVRNGTTYITNSIIASHTVGIERFGGTVTEDYNLFSDNTNHYSGTITAGTHSLIGPTGFANPATNDYHLLASSAALNAGANLGVLTDYEGDLRPQGAGFDLGYDEAPISVTLSAANSSPNDPSTTTYFTATLGYGSNFAFTWDFGDGSATTSGITTTHTYPTAGTYTATVTATNNVGSLTAQTIVVIGGNYKVYLPFIRKP